ncbi:hypothetical protein EDD31_0224 [Bogoriella caseilytica]|uniref:Uncharacterized protein n=2 Tax=Bogoriella caseilytica TaxID=56055 RepID=A0A3N2B9D8_9MICO|nr:hypothetical protein EDD31_0224 [Bogoriella caseilytica]
MLTRSPGIRSLAAGMRDWGTTEIDTWEGPRMKTSLLLLASSDDVAPPDHAAMEVNPFLVGGVVLALLLGMLLFTFAFRNVASRL